jgi:hypothetical protein|tara:strand:+ start:197 stop:442 length:246 start_codon:yes stop_codon:yes gene_type:complete
MICDVFSPKVYQEDLSSQIGGLVNPAFTTSRPFILGSIEVFINGLKQRLETDVEELSVTQFRILDTIVGSDIIDVVYLTTC